MSTTSVFAPEISDLIIDQLWDDFAALKSCARISRAWTARSRFHLFWQASISTQDRKRTKAFFKLLRSPHQTIRPFICSLSICHTPSYQDRQILDGRFDEWIMEAVPDLIRLTSVRSLTLHFDTDSESLPYLFLPGFREGLTDLTIRGHWNCTQWRITRFVCSYPRLERLALHHSGQVRINSIETPDNGPNLSKSLHTLCIYCAHQTPFLQWLSSLNLMPPLHTVRLTGLNPDQLRFAGELLRGLGSNLEHLELELNAFHPFTDIQVDFGYNPRLLSFAISIPSQFFPTRDTARQNILQLLSTIVSTDIQEVSIRDIVKHNSIFNGDFCSALAVLLEKQPFLNLRRVVISFSDVFGRAHRETTIREELEDFEARGMLCLLDASVLFPP